MIETRHESSDGLPFVGWQGKKANAYRLFRLQDRSRPKKPADGHDPTIPHRIGFHAMMLVTSGSRDHWLDFETHRFSKNQLIYIAPNQIHHFINSKRSHKAWLLIFQPETLPAELLQIEEGQSPWSIMAYRWPHITNLKPKQTELLDQQLTFLHSLILNHSNMSGVAMNFHICGIISTAFEFAAINPDESLYRQADQQFFGFVRLVEQCFAVHRDAKWYAKQMDCSSRTLDRICMRAAGKSAKAFLSDRVVTEAKRLLTYSRMSINDVSENLGFSASTNFARHFRNKTGMTPQEFRSKH